MKKKDFLELIDLKSEYKEYTRFDLGKSKKFRSYMEWDTHMKAILATIESSTDMYNLKRYCMDVIRSNDDIGQIFWGYIGLSFPLLLAFTTENDRFGLKGLFLMVALMGLLFHIIRTTTTVSRKKHFYQDILTIIEQIENCTPSQ